MTYEVFQYMTDGTKLQWAQFRLLSDAIVYARKVSRQNETQVFIWDEHTVQHALFENGDLIAA